MGKSKTLRSLEVRSYSIICSRVLLHLPSTTLGKYFTYICSTYIPSDSSNDSKSSCTGTEILEFLSHPGSLIFFDTAYLPRIYFFLLSIAFAFSESQLPASSRERRRPPSFFNFLHIQPWFRHLCYIALSVASQGNPSYCRTILNLVI